MNMRLFSLLVVLLSAGCAAPLNVERIGEGSLDPNNKNLVLLARTRYLPDIRMALAKRGFKVEKFSTVREIERALSKGEKERFLEAEARYGLDIYFGRRVDWCVLNDGILLSEVTFEVSDLHTNEVLLYVEAGGWTKPCAWHTDVVWEELADALAKAWK